MAQQDQRSSNALERIIIIFLFIVTVTLFSTWGYEIAVYLLGQYFDVAIEDVTLASFFVGVIAMISSVLIFVGGVLLWRQHLSAKPYFIAGAVGFVVKNALDITNQVWVFSRTTPDPDAADIKMLATELGSEALQAAFWVFVLVYFLYRIRLYRRVGFPPDSPQPSSAPTPSQEQDASETSGASER